MKPFLTQRRHGVWYIVSVGENGKRKFISTGTKDREQADRMPVYFTRAEIARLVDGIDKPWLMDIILFALSTGIRQGELLQLEWPHVDLRGRMIRITSSERFRTKTGKFRIVPLNETAMTVVREREALGERWVFTQDGLQIKQDWLTHAFKKTIRRLSMREELHFHSLRHTFASWLVQDGVSLFQVGRLLGHTDTKTTVIYAHLQPETMHDVVDRIKL